MLNITVRFEPLIVDRSILGHELSQSDQNINPLMGSTAMALGFCMFPLISDARWVPSKLATSI